MALNRRVEHGARRARASSAAVARAVAGGCVPELLEPRLLWCAFHEALAAAQGLAPADAVDAPGVAAPVTVLTARHARRGAVASGQTAAASHADLALAFGGTKTTDTLAGSAKTAAANPPLPGLPVLHSFPSAPAAIYLDFNGNGSMTPYDVDGDATTFNATEQAQITEAWRQLSIYFAPFNVDVTTVKPTVPTAWALETNSLTGVGYSYVGVFPNSTPESFNPAGDTRTRESGIAHEVGHNFGLQHQSDYDLLGNKTNEYSSGYDATHGPIMGVDYARSIHKWFIGHNSTSAGTLQDDIAVISGRIAAQSGGGDGFHPDDYGNTIAAATALPVSGGVQTATGVIERMTDADAFSFTSTGGRMDVEVNPVNPSGLIPKIEVYDAAGNLVAAKDDADARGTTNNDVSVPVNLPAGTYYAVVKSHGDYDDLGQYTVTATALPGGWTSQWVGAPSLQGDYAAYDAASGTYTIAGSGGGTWATTDQGEYAYTTLSGDGSVVARVASMGNTNSFAKSGLMVRESLADDAKQVTVNATPTSGPQFIYRPTTTAGITSVNTTAAAFAPIYLKVSRVGNTFTGSRSTDGVTWTTIGSGTVAMNANVYVGLFSYSKNGAALDTATFDNVATTGGVNVAPTLNALPAPTGLAASLAATDTGLSLSWSAAAGATGYAVERSIDGTDFTQVATTAAGVTTYADAGLFGSMRYFYRVRALGSGSTVSAPSVVATAVNRPSAPFSLAVTSWQADKVILNWRDVSGDTGYRIDRSTDGGVTFSPLASVAANVPMYVVTGLTANTSAAYRVVALSAQGDSAASATATGSTRLAATTGLAFTSITSSQMAMQWTPVPGATGYRVDRSTDGTTFSPLTTLGASATTYADPTVGTLGEYYYRVVGTNAQTESATVTPIFAAAPAVSPTPAPWQSQDVGTQAGAGATGYASGTFTQVANGNDIWNSADQMRFTYTTLIGDGTIVARVNLLENTDDWAKAGVMVRESLAGNAKDAISLISAANGTQFQYRATTGGSSVAGTAVAGKAAPYWVKLVRAGNVFTAFASPDGVTWTQTGTATVAMTASRVYVGLASTSHTTNTLSTTTFDNVSVTGTTAPTYQADTIGDGTAQRSMLTGVTLAFDRPVASSDAGAFVLTRRDPAGGAATNVPVTMALAPDGFTATISPTAGGTLADGVYDLIVHNAMVRDLAGQGSGGGDQTFTFHRLYGDINGDATVNNADNFQFKNTYLKSLGDTGYIAAFDVNGDGTVNNADNFQFKQRYLVTYNY